MSLAPGVEVFAENGHEFEARIAGIAERMANPHVAFGAIMREFEHEEESIFAEYGGKYVKSGALKESLTGSGSGAVRHLTPSGFEFGSALFYARFQGTTGPGDHGAPSAVLKLTPAEIEMAPRTVMEYIVHGGSIPL